MRHRPGGTADGMTTEHEIRDALATSRHLKMEKCTLLDGGAYVVVTHTNGARWTLTVKRATCDAGADEMARDIAATVAQHMMVDAMELLRPKSDVIAWGYER